MLQDALVFHFLKNDPTPNKLKMQGSKTGAKSKRVIVSVFQKESKDLNNELHTLT